MINPRAQSNNDKNNSIRSCRQVDRRSVVQFMLFLSLFLLLVATNVSLVQGFTNNNGNGPLSSSSSTITNNRILPRWLNRRTSTFQIPTSHRIVVLGRNAINYNKNDASNTALFQFLQPQQHDHAVSLAGSIWPAIQKFQIGPMKWKEIVHNVKLVTEWQEIIILPILAFAVFPLTQFYLKWKHNRILTNAGITDPNEKEEQFKSIMKQQKKDIFSTYNWAQRISQIGQVAFSVYLVDVISVFLTTIGFKFPAQIQLSTSYAKIAYTWLVISRILFYKKLALCQFFRVKPNEMGQVDILNRILDGIIASIGALLVFDWLSIKMGNAMTGIVAFSSVGTLAFTLASQGLVREFLSGFVLIFGNKMNPGDTVIFGDGTSGKVLNIGWLESSFRGPDNIETRVPNALLSSQKVSNVSRVKVSRVYQTLRFRYEDAKKLPTLMDDIRTEILKSCPRLITDPSIRPFRVYWTDFKEDHLEVIVDTHHRIAPNSEEYYKNRQNVLSAILRAVENNNVELQHD